MGDNKFLTIAQTTIGSLILGIMVWVGSSVQQGRENFIKMNENIVSLQSEIKDFKRDWKETTTSAAATFADHEKRLSAIEWWRANSDRIPGGRR